MKDARHLISTGQQPDDLQRSSAASPPFVPNIPPGYSSYGVETGGQENETPLLDYWRAVRKHLPLVIGVTALITVLVAIYMARKPDIYEATARVQVNLEGDTRFNPSKNGAVVVSPNPVNDPTYFNTQLQIINGQGLLRRVAKKLDLENKSNLKDGAKQSDSVLSSVLRLFGLGGKEAKKNADESDSLAVSSDADASVENPEEARKLEPYVMLLRQNLTVEQVKDPRQTFRETRLIDIKYQDTDPKFASLVVNTIAETFAAQNLEKRIEVNEQTGKFLASRIAELQKKIREQEEQLIDYAKRNNILSLDENKKNVDVERLALLTNQLTEAENDRKRAEAEMKAAQETKGGISALVESSGKDNGAGAQIAEIKAKIAGLRAQRQQLLVDVTEAHPDVQAIDEQIAVYQDQLNNISQRAGEVTATNLSIRYQQAVKRENAIRAALNEQRGRVVGQNEAAVQYRIIQQGIETDKAQLASLMQSEKDNQVVSSGITNNVQIVDRSIPPTFPIGPNRLRAIILAMMMALGLGVGLALLLEYLDNTVRTVDDVEKNLRLPLLAMIPTASELSGRRRLLLGAGGNGADASTALVGVDSRSPIAEAYRQLRTSVMLSTAGRAPRTLLITSSVPAEGKTTMAVNIAKSLAQTGARVLIIDADMRRPRQHAIFGVSNREGLSTYLSSEKTEEELLDMIKHHEESGLYVLTAGPVPPNPAELLGSDQMRRLLSIAEAKFTQIVVDSPPIASFTDGVLLASMVDGVLLVVHGGKTPRETVRRSRQLLQDVGARIFGVVLNNVNLRAHDYYYQSYYQSYYDYSSPNAEEAGEDVSVTSSAK